MSAVSPSWSWRPDRQTRVAIRRGDHRYAEYRRELAERIAAERREYLARRAGA